MPAVLSVFPAGGTAPVPIGGNALERAIFAVKPGVRAGLKSNKNYYSLRIIL